MPTKNTKVQIKTEHSLILMSTEDDNWELTEGIIGRPHERTIADPPITIYMCYHDGVLVWVESYKGLALQRFMSIIPNEIREKI